MPISAAERRNQDERLRSTQEEAQDREVQLIKRKNQELQRAEKRHQEELKALTDDYQKQLNSVKTSGREKLTSRDLEFQKKIGDMREAQKNQLRKKMEENFEEKTTLKETYQSELDKRKEINESQFKNLSEQQKAELQVRDERLGEVYSAAKEKVDEALNSNKRKFHEIHEKEKKLLIEGRFNEVQQAKLENQRLRDTYEGELKQGKRQKDLEVGAWNQKYVDLAKNNKEISQQRLESQSALFEETRNRLNDKYRKSAEQKDQGRQSATEAFKDSVAGRINDQIRSRDSRIAGLQEKLNNQTSQDTRLRGLEQLHLQEGYEAKLQDVESQKDQMREAFQDLTHKRVGETMRKNDQVLRQSFRDHKSQMALLNTKQGQDRADLLDLHKNQLETLQTLAEKRIERIDRDRSMNQEKLSGFYEENIEQLRDNYSTKLMEQREANLNNVSQTGKSLAKRFKDREAALLNRIESVTSNYENKIEKIKDDHEKEIKHIEGVFAQKMGEKEKAHKFERDSLEAKYLSKAALTEEQSQDRFERLQKKHEEDIRNLANRYSRKA